MIVQLLIVQVIVCVRLRGKYLYYSFSDQLSGMKLNVSEITDADQHQQCLRVTQSRKNQSHIRIVVRSLCVQKRIRLDKPLIWLQCVWCVILF